MLAGGNKKSNDWMLISLNSETNLKHCQVSLGTPKLDGKLWKSCKGENFMRLSWTNYTQINIK
jgi:hypothetical protein